MSRRRRVPESVTRVLHTGRGVRVLKIAANHVQHHLARDTQRRAAKGIEWVLEAPEHIPVPKMA